GVSGAASVDSPGAGVRSPSPDGLEVSRIKYCAAPPPTTTRTMMTARIVSVFLIGGSYTPLSWQGSRIWLAVACLCLVADQCDDFRIVLVRTCLLYALSCDGHDGDVIVRVAGGVSCANKLVFYTSDVDSAAGDSIEKTSIGSINLRGGGL